MGSQPAYGRVLAWAVGGLGQGTDRLPPPAMQCGDMWGEAEIGKYAAENGTCVDWCV